MPPVSNPVIDTLALSHYLFPEAARHTLGALSRNLDLDVYDEGDAHRADYDAEALNNVWQVIIPILTKDAEHLTQADLAHLVSTNQNFFKHLRSYHMVYQLWNPTWILFLAIPLYYIAFGPIDKVIRKHHPEDYEIRTDEDDKTDDDVIDVDVK